MKYISFLGLGRFWPRSLVSCVYPECVWNNTSSCRDMVGHSDIPVRSHVICIGGRSNGVFCRRRRRRLTFALSAFVLCFRRVAHDYLFAMVSYVPITNSRAIQRDSWTAHPTILLQYNKPVILFIKPIRSWVKINSICNIVRKLLGMNRFNQMRRETWIIV